MLITLPTEELHRLSVIQAVDAKCLRPSLDLTEHQVQRLMNRFRESDSPAPQHGGLLPG